MLLDTSSDSDEISAATKWWVIGNLPNKRFSVHPINRRRNSLGEYHHLFSELKNDPDRFHSYMRMTPETFNYILELLTPQLDHCVSHHIFHVTPILAEEKLVVTIRYLATGCSFKTLAFSFRMGASTVASIVKTVTKGLWTVLQPLHMPTPTTADYQRIAGRFNEVWNFPNCIGAIDGKHCRIKCPTHSGSMYYNYRHFFSIVLQAVADDHYKFVFIDVGGYGKQSDGGTFAASDVGRMLESNKLAIPEDTNLPFTNIKVPHVLIADEAYPLRENLMRPFPKDKLGVPQEIFNKRLSRARKTVECAFGILFSKWRILSGCIETQPKFADVIIKSVCLLHNVIIDKDGFCGDLEDLPPIPARCNLNAVGRSRNAKTKRAKAVRRKFVDYFVANPLKK